MAPLAFPLRRRRSREQCLLCEGLPPPPPQTYPPHPPFSPFLFPSHSLLSDVDWIGLETGRCGEQRRRWWKWQCVCRVWIPRCAFDAFARQTRAYVTCGEGKQRARERKRETFKCLLQVCENNWKGKRLKTRKHTILNLSLVVFFFFRTQENFLRQTMCHFQAEQRHKQKQKRSLRFPRDATDILAALFE